ncbi:MAG: hypothetical protein ABI761_04070 [Saprospiraceae bacterium]
MKISFGTGKKHFLEFTSVLFILLFTQQVSAQGINQKTSDYIHFLDSMKVVSDSHLAQRPIEKIYFHFDKQFYFPGEICWYAAYILQGFDLRPTEQSGVLHIQWFDQMGRRSHDQLLKITEGKASGDMIFDSSFLPGEYTIIAYTQWMMNDSSDYFYSKKIHILNPLGDTGNSTTGFVSLKPDIQFFPEGGRNVDHIPNNIAFKVIDPQGRGLFARGIIVDNENNMISTFKTLYQGMGVLAFTPSSDKIYQAILETGEMINFPKTEVSGLVLSVNNTNSKNIFVRIQASQDYLNSSVTLIAQHSGKICYASQVLLASDKKDITIPKDSFPDGVLQLTLFDEQGHPECERMVFINHESKINSTIKCADEFFTPRDSIMIQLVLKDHHGQTQEMPVSVAITDASMNSMELNNENIFTRLLLQSELKGLIENPAWYFESPDPQKIYALDLVMLTHGWSRYTWNKPMQYTDTIIKFQHEYDLSIHARAVSANSQKPIPKGQITLMVSNQASVAEALYFAESDSSGKFIIENMDFNDSTTLSWQIKNAKGKAKRAMIKIDEREDTLPPSLFTYQLPGLNPNYTQDILPFIDKYKEFNYDKNPSSILLNEVTVVARQQNQIREIGTNASLIRPTVLDLKTGSNQFISKHFIPLPFLKPLTLQDGSIVWTYGHYGPVRVIIDGINANYLSADNNPYLAIQSVPVDQIDYVIIQSIILKGTTIFIKTKKEFENSKTDFTRQLVKGYNKNREFYHPKYGPADEKSSVADHRITLYWNPDLKTDKNGQATIKFYNSDIAKKIVVTMEGIQNGRPLTITKTFGK